MNQDILKGYIAGLIEGEGHFGVSLQKSRPQFKMPFEIRPIFIIYMSIKEKEMLEKIKDILKVGNVFTRKNKKDNQNDFIRYQVSGLRNCIALTKYLNSVEFLGTKKRTYKLWKDVIEIIKENKHGTKEGILEIAKIRDKMHFLEHKNYRDYNWFKNHLDTHYKDYQPSSKFETKKIKPYR